MLESRQQRGIAAYGGVYFITPRNGAGGGHVSAARSAIEGGVRIVQYSEKGAAAPIAEREARAIKELCRAHGAMFIINDDADLARRVEPEGIHVGQGDMPVRSAARMFPGSVIGVSVESVLQAREAEEHGASYLGVTIFPSRTNPSSRPVGLDGLRAIRESTSLPIYPIGGGCHRHLAELRSIGADGIVVISAISGSPDMAAAASWLVGEWAEAHPARRALRKG